MNNYFLNFLFGGILSTHKIDSTVSHSGHHTPAIGNSQAAWLQGRNIWKQEDGSRGETGAADGHSPPLRCSGGSRPPGDRTANPACLTGSVGAPEHRAGTRPQRRHLNPRPGPGRAAVGDDDRPQGGLSPPSRPEPVTPGCLTPRDDGLGAHTFPDLAYRTTQPTHSSPQRCLTRQPQQHPAASAEPCKARKKGKLS